MINHYVKQVLFLMNDQRMQHLNPDDVIGCVNHARREIAVRTQCVRIVTPITGRIISASVVSVGVGYTNPTVSISAPDYPSGALPYPNGLQAVATVNVSSGSIAGINLTYGGEGYWNPVISIVDPTGSGAVVSMNTAGFSVTAQGQEQYKFADIDLSNFAGIDSVYAVKSVSLLYNNFRYSLPCYGFSSYQAFVRQSSLQYRSAPAICAQLGRGTGGILYMYPIPDQPYQLELDCFCLPAPLSTVNNFVEVIPEPFTDVVQYYAAHLCAAAMQEFNQSMFYMKLFEEKMKVYLPQSSVSRWCNPYGRY